TNPATSTCEGSNAIRWSGAWSIADPVLIHGDGRTHRGLVRLLDASDCRFGLPVSLDPQQESRPRFCQRMGLVTEPVARVVVSFADGTPSAGPDGLCRLDAWVCRDRALQVKGAPASRWPGRTPARRARRRSAGSRASCNPWGCPAARRCSRHTARAESPAW